MMSNHPLHITPWTIVLLTLVTLRFSAFGEDTIDKPLRSVTFVFEHWFPQVIVDVPVRCSDRESARNCTCSMNDASGMDHPTFFIRPKPLQPDIGFLQYEGYNIGCKKNYRAITPNITMISDFAGGAVRNCVFADKTTCKSVFKSDLENGLQIPPAEPSINSKSTTNDPSLNLRDNEYRLVQEALKTSGGSTTQAAKKLGISEKALLRKMGEYKTDHPSR